MDTSSRTEKLLTILVLQSLGNASQAQKIEAISRAGFSNQEVAQLIGTTPAVVSQTLYAARGAKVAKKAAPKKKPVKRSK
jgi:predicted transcriptional regulator